MPGIVMSSVTGGMKNSCLSVSSVGTGPRRGAPAPGSTSMTSSTVWRLARLLAIFLYLLSLARHPTNFEGNRAADAAGHLGLSSQTALGKKL